MVNLSEIGQVISNPNLLRDIPLTDLKELCDRYPYSQVFPLLYLKGLAVNNDIRFDDELIKHAYKVTDRVRLHEIIHSQTNDVQVIEQEFESPISVVEQESEVLLDKIEEEKIEVQDDLPITPEVVKEEEIIEHSESIETEKEDSTLPEMDEFDRQILASTISSNYHLEPLEEDEAASVDDFPTFSPKERKHKETFEKEEFFEEEINEEEEDISVMKPMEIDLEKSFSSWLKSDSNSKISAIEKPSISPIKHSDTAEEKEENPELFAPKTTKKEFFSPTKKAKESLNEDSLPVSETLAKIYAAQGNFPKAISSYQQLMLIIPEKKIFFANQIKELEQKLNS